MDRREKQRMYQRSTHAELRGLFHGPMNPGAGGLMTKRTEILEWISTVPYTNHHKRISIDRIEGTGRWIFKKEKYRAWKESTNSMLLLLRGISGAGKTYIASQVIDSLLSNPTPESKLAYFYCNRAEQSRRDPESILRAIVRQLAQTLTNDELLSPVLDIYKGREKAGQLTSRLTLGECRDLLVQLVAVYPQTTICIDAVDEIDQQLRLELLEVLRHVVERSNTQVKIFATTRMDIDIHLQLEMIPMIELEPDNVDDIKRFVEVKVQGAIERKQLLDGNVPNALKTEICHVLCERARGVFQLAALQLTLLCDMVIPRDVRDSLKVLPESLADAYGEIYNRILTQRGSAPRLALNAFRWVLCSYEPLQSETLLDAVTVEIDGSGGFSSESMALRATDLLKACQNLLILDECLNVFRFAHLSAEEFLETQQLFVDSHSEIAKICLSLVCSSRSWMDYEATLETREGRFHDRHLLLYAAVFWPWHLSRCKDSCQILTALWEAFVSEPTFHHWIDNHCQRVQTADSKDAPWIRSKDLQNEAVEKSKSSTTSTCDSIQRGRTDRMQPCTSMFGDLEITKHLLDASDGRTPIHIAAGTQKGRHELAPQRGDRGVGGCCQATLQAEAENRDVEAAQLLVDRGANVLAAKGDGWTPLHAAAQNGHEALARLLMGGGGDPAAPEGD